MRPCVLGALLLFSLCVAAVEVQARSGCCSWHGGIAYCDTAVGRYVCNDGEYSPTCGCEYAGQSSSERASRRQRDSGGGKSDPLVIAVQRCLLAVGCNPGPPDGVAGQKTSDAFFCFLQRRYRPGAPPANSGEALVALADATLELTSLAPETEEAARLLSTVYGAYRPRAQPQPTEEVRPHTTRAPTAITDLAIDAYPSAGGVPPTSPGPDVARLDEQGPAGVQLESMSTAELHDAERRIRAARELQQLGLGVDWQQHTWAELNDWQMRIRKAGELEALGVPVDWRTQTWATLQDWTMRVRKARELAALGLQIDWRQYEWSVMQDWEVRIRKARELHLLGIDVDWRDYSWSQLMDMELRQRAIQRLRTLQ